LIAIAALTLTFVLGMISPDPEPSGLSNLILLGFGLSFLVAFATIVVLIPSPPDPRRALRRGSNDEDAPDARASTMPQSEDLRESGHRQ
jgi:hypothetical protein